MPLRAANLVIALSLLSVLPGTAAAQRRSNALWRLRAHDAVSVISSFSRGAHGPEVRIELVRVALAAAADPAAAGAGDAPALTGPVTHGHADGAARLVYQGGPVGSVPVATPEGAAVITWGADPASVTVHLVRLDVPATDAHAITHVALDRPAGGASRPFAAVACLRDASVVVLWNEVGPGTGMAAQSYLARVGLDGTVVEAPHVVQIPWSLAALAHTADGYQLAVRYDGSAPNQTRICLVHLTDDATPTEHPWWATRPAMVGDVQLVPSGGGVRIVYATPEGLLASPARTTGQWGQDPPASAHLAPATSFAAGARANGEPAVAVP